MRASIHPPLAMDLFDDAPLPPSALLQIEQPLSKDQKTFNTLLKKIEARRRDLAEWQRAELDFRQRYQQSLAPLLAQGTALRIEMAQALDRAHSLKGLGKVERRKVSSFIVDLTAMLLEQEELDAALEASLKALYNKHGKTDFDAEQAEEKEMMQAIFGQAFEHTFGVELGANEDITSEEELMQHFQQRIKEETERRNAGAKPRKKSAKQLAKEAQRAEQEAQMSQSIREVFRKLASALHPDREQDPAEKQRKTQLMQRANDAYKKGNLLQLLELQLELEHIDQTHLANLSGERLKHYLSILKDQVAELDQEIAMIEDHLRFGFNLPPVHRLKPQLLPTLIEQNVRIHTEDIKLLREQIDLTTDLVRLRVLLKRLMPNKRRGSDFDDIPF